MENKEESNEAFNKRSLHVMERMGNEVQMLTESIREMTNKQDQMISQQKENVDAIQHFAVSMTNILEKTLCSGDSPRQTQSEDSRPQSQFWGMQSNQRVAFGTASGHLMSTIRIWMDLAEEQPLTLVLIVVGTAPG